MSECCDICDTIGNPYAYWAFNARPSFEGFYSFKDQPLRGGVYESYVNNPVIKQYWDVYNNDLDDAPEASRWNMYLLKTRAKGIGGRSSSENKLKLSSYKDWKVKCFPTTDIGIEQIEHIFGVNFDITDNTNWPTLDDQMLINPNYGGFGFEPRDGLNSFLYNPRIAGHRTWACYHDDVQKYVVMEGTMAKENHLLDEDYLEGMDIWLDNNYYTIFSVIDIESQSVLRQYMMPFISYDTVLYDVDNEPLTPSENTPVVYGYCQEYVSRANFTANPWYTLFSSYDDWGNINTDGWVAYRFPIDSTLTQAGGPSSLTEEDEFAVIRGAYHSYTYGESPDKEPWVIAVRRSDSTWVTGRWETAVTVPNPDTEVGGMVGTLTLHDDDTINELTTGVMSENAVLICYNRVRQRDLAIWIDPGVENTDWSGFPGGVAPSVEVSEGVFVDALYYLNQYVYVYDSDRSPQFYAHEFKVVVVYPPDTAYPPDECTLYNDEDDGVPFGSIGTTFTEGYPGTRHKYIFSDSRLDQIPTFITCDKDNMVYMGCPNYIFKSGRYANRWTGEIAEEGNRFTGNADSWMVHFRAFYKRVPFNVPGPCQGPGGTTAMEPEQEEYKRSGGTSGINYGFMNSREFAILPTAKGIHIRGCEGAPQMATTNDFSNIDYYKPPGILIGEGSRSMWLTDWIFSFDANQRVPCIEEAYLAPRFMISEQQWAYSQYEGPETLSDFEDWSDPAFALPPTSYKFRDYFKYVNDNDLTVSGLDYEIYFADQNRGNKYYISRRYYDELLHDYFTMAPLESRMSSFTFSGGAPGIIVWPYWETVTNEGYTFINDLATRNMISPFLLETTSVQENTPGTRTAMDAVCFGFQYTPTGHRDKGWTLDFRFGAPDDLSPLWDNYGTVVVSSLQDSYSFGACWIRNVQTNNDSNEVPSPYRGILLDVVDLPDV